MRTSGGVVTKLAMGLMVASWFVGPVDAAVVINEIMYNSIESPDVEFVEIYNTGSSAQDLAGWYLLDANPAHDKCYLVGTLQPGEYLVIAGFLAAFQAKYPGVTNLNANQYDSDIEDDGFSLGNGGDKARLFNDIGSLRDWVEYDDLQPWPEAANGTGPSLELINPALDGTLASSWCASGGSGGTPGAQNSCYALDQPPIIDSVFRDFAVPTSMDTVTVTAHGTDDLGVPQMALWVDEGSGYVSQPMFDDGDHGDGQAGDQVFGALIGPHDDGTLVKYYIEATDSFPQTTVYPQNAPAINYLAYTVGYEAPYLVVNEVLASNLTGIVDNFGQYEDWAEIRNRGTKPVNVGGMFLSFDFSLPQVWQLPAVAIDPGGYLLVWCDNDTSQGPLHANFKLTAARGDVGLFDSVDHGNIFIHGLGYGGLVPDVSFGYYPDDADAAEYLSLPTPGASNDSSAPLGSIVINEFLTTSTAGGLDDWLELYNRGTSDVDIGGWHVTDERDQPTKFTFDTPSVIPAGGFLSVGEVELDFGWSSSGSEVIMLLHPGGASGEDYFDYGPQTADVTQGRFADGTPNWQFFWSGSRDLSNSCAGGVAPSGAVSSVVFDGSDDVLAWDPLPGAEAYDVVRGLLSLLRSTGGDFSVAVDACPENNDRLAESWQPDVPDADEGFFYLVRGVTYSCGFGSYDSAGVRQMGTRDAEILAAGGACP